LLWVARQLEPLAPMLSQPDRGWCGGVQLTLRWNKGPSLCSLARGRLRERV